MRPVAQTLATLAPLLGHGATTADHLAEAVDIADAWHAPLWRTEARAALASARPRPPSG
jgi:hypothetical protein